MYLGRILKDCNREELLELIFCQEADLDAKENLIYRLTEEVNALTKLVGNSEGSIEARIRSDWRSQATRKYKLDLEKKYEKKYEESGSLNVEPERLLD